MLVGVSWLEFSQIVVFVIASLNFLKLVMCLEALIFAALICCPTSMLL